MRFGEPRRVDPTREWAKTYASYLATLRENVSNGVGLTIWGDGGTGKTTLATHLAHVCIRRHVSVAFVPEYEILNGLKRTFSNDGDITAQKVIDTLVAPDVLIIDDFGVARATEWVQESYHPIIDARLHDHKPIILTTNLTPDQIAERYPRQADRLNINIDMPFEGYTFRK